MDTPPSVALSYRKLQSTHEDYDPKYWRLLRALYSGGKSLLREEAVMDEAFPKHAAERSDIYKERKKRAFYVNYAGTIIDHLGSGLSGDPITVSFEDEDKKLIASQKIVDWYSAFVADCSAAGGRCVPWNQHLKTQIREALITKVAWTLIDLPDIGDASPETLAQQEALGARDAYAVAFPAELVRNWKLDGDGNLKWVLTCQQSRPQDDLTDRDDLIREEYTYYTATHWVRFVVDYTDGEPADGDNEIKRPEPDDMIPGIAGVHSFGAVPLLRLELPDGLWAMNKVESLAREHFNKSNALGWAQYKDLFQQLFLFLGTETSGIDAPISENQSDPDRGVNQTRGIGYSQVYGEDDKASYVGPDTAGFEHARKWLVDIRDEIHRVLHEMRLASDRNASAQRQTAEAKAQDQELTTTILQALGDLAKEHTTECFEMVARGRGDKDLEPTIAGGETFDAMSVDALIAQALVLENIAIPSQTFQRKYKLKLARQAVGDDATDSDVATMEKELERNLNAEMFDPMIEGPGIGDEDDDDDKKGSDKKNAA